MFKLVLKLAEPGLLVLEQGDPATQDMFHLLDHLGHHFDALTRYFWHVLQRQLIGLAVLVVRLNALECATRVALQVYQLVVKSLNALPVVLELLSVLGRQLNLLLEDSLVVGNSAVYDFHFSAQIVEIVKGDVGSKFYFYLVVNFVLHLVQRIQDDLN